MRGLSRRLVWLGAEEVGEDAALLGAEDALVAAGTEHHLALIERHGAQIAEGALHQHLAIRRQRSHPLAGHVEPHPVLGRHVLQRFGAGQAAIALVIRQLIHLVQLLQDPLLVRRGQPIEAGVAAQGPLLVLNGLAAMLVEPVAEVPWRRGAQISGTRASIARPSLGAIRRTSVSGRTIGSRRIGRALRSVVGGLTLHRIALRTGLVLGDWTALVLLLVRLILWRLGARSLVPRRRRGTSRRVIVLAVKRPGRGRTGGRDHS